jgi:hypothetical protein
LSSSPRWPSCCSRRPPTAHTILSAPPAYLCQALQVGAAVLHGACDVAQTWGHPECYLTLWHELAMGLGYAMGATRSSTN